MSFVFLLCVFFYKKPSIFQTRTKKRLSFAGFSGCSRFSSFKEIMNDLDNKYYFRARLTQKYILMHWTHWNARCVIIQLLLTTILLVLPLTQASTQSYRTEWNPLLTHRMGVHGRFVYSHSVHYYTIFKKNMNDLAHNKYYFSARKICGMEISWFHSLVLKSLKCIEKSFYKQSSSKWNFPF